MQVVDLKNADGLVRCIDEGDSANIEFTLQDTAGNVLPAIDSLTLTLYDRNTLAIINSQNGTDILNNNNGTFDTGAVVMRLQPADNAVVGPIDNYQEERHIAEFTFTYTDNSVTPSITRTGVEPMQFRVMKIPTPT